MNDSRSIPPHIRWLLLGLLLVAAAVLRIDGACNDLWLDEIWSLKLVSQISAPWQVFTRIHHTNNHYLYSLWLYLCGARGNWPGYRLPAVAAGIGCVVLAGLIGRRRDSLAAVFGMVLVAFSYVQILYSSEARGYSAAIFFSFLAFYALDRYLEKPDGKFAALFSVSSILGMASHLAFLNFFAAAVLWSGWRLVKSGLGSKRTLKALLACHAAPAIFLTVLYFVDIRLTTTDGGTETSLPGVYASSFAWTLGGPPGHFPMLVATFLAAALFVGGLRLLSREQPDELIFYITVIFAAPVLLALASHSNSFYVRYFIVGMAFLLILFSRVLAALCRRGPAGAAVAAVFLAGYLACNGWNTFALFQYGRGHYADATQFLVDHTAGPVTTIGGDQDFRIALVLQFYAREATGNKRIAYFPSKSWPKGGPEWFVCHKESFDDPAPPGPQMTDNNGNQYDFVKTFPTAPLSGLHWFVYHNRAYASAAVIR